MNIARVLPILVVSIFAVAPFAQSEESTSANKNSVQHPASDNGFYSSGTAFLATCSVVARMKEGKGQRPSDIADARACQSYVRGIMDGVNVQHMWSRSHGDPTKAAFCVQFENLAPVELVRAVLQYLRDHPEEQRFSASIAVEEVLHNKFPCRNPSNS